MPRRFSPKRIVLTAAVDWLGTLLALLLAAWLRARLIELTLPISGARPGYDIPLELEWYPALLAPQVFVLVAAIWPFFLVIMGAYDGRRNASLKAELLNVFMAVSLATLTLASTLFFTYRATSRLLFIIFFLLSLVAVCGVRISLWGYRLWLRGQAQVSGRPLLAAPAGRALARQLETEAWAVEAFGGLPVVDAGQPGIYGWRRVSKRVFDLVLSSVGLVLISPLLLLIALAVRLESPGPTFYRQRRIGENGRPFTMFKFRSMVADADHDLHYAHVRRLIEHNLSLVQLSTGGQGSLKLARDPRVTRVGGLIRRTSLDELPQLFNVLRGEMSLVGPRPPIEYEVALYQDWHKRRLTAPPGITGLWQVRGRNRVSFDEMVRMDLEYIERQSFWLDLQLLIQTPLAVVDGQGAG